MKIVKRSGELVQFDENKIIIAIEKAMGETEEGVNNDLSTEIANRIKDDMLDVNYIHTVESIQDMVEDHLMGSKRKDAARQYILYRAKKNTIRKEGWKMSDLQRDIYEKKYRFEGESFDEFLNRVSGGNTYIRKLMRDKKFLPAGRILANRGLNERGKKVCYSNCFVNEAPQDNLESIFHVAGQTARTYSYGGGVGLTLENLRPRGATVNNSATETTGAVSFMELYSMTTGLIGQNARRKIA